MATKIVDVRPSSALAELIEEHQAAVARLRAEVGDPEEALSAFVREHFDQTALALAYDAMLRYPGAWADDEDEIERGADGEGN
jgi:hypothetical protein